MSEGKAGIFSDENLIIFALKAELPKVNAIIEMHP